MIVTTISAAPAEAQAPGNATTEALRLHRRSHELYNLGRYAEAAELLREAYRLKPVPILQYNLARACERLGDYACAIEAYESYLPHALYDERPAIEARLIRYRKRLANWRSPAAPMLRAAPSVQQALSPLQQAPPQPQAPPRVPQNASDRPRHRLLPPIAAAIGAVALGVGGALALQARATNEDALADPSPPAARDKRARAEALMSAANATMIGGGMVAVAGAAWWILDRRAFHRRPTAARLHIGPGTVAISGAF